jgi:putative ABC transport system ATP-binding protein
MRITKRSLYYWILHRQHGLQFVLLLIILVSLIFRVFPLEMQKRIVNQAIELKDHQLLFLYCGLYFSAVLLAGITKYAINYLQILIGQKILVDMRTELYNHILQLPLHFFRTMQPGTVISAMTAELNAIGFFIGGALAIPITSVLTYLALLGYMISVNPLLALLSSSFYPIEFFIIPRLQQRYNKWNKKRIRTIRTMSNVVNEAVSGIHDVQSYAGFHFEAKRLQSSIQQLYQTLKRLFLIKYGIKFTDNLFQSFGPLILFLIGGYLAIEGQFTLGALVAFLSAYEKIYAPWKEMLAFYQSYQDAQVRYRQIMQIFDFEPIHALLPPENIPLRTAGRLKIEHVHYNLPGGTPLLNRINLTIEPGEQIAVVGFSGSGKSTLALLIDQLYEASGGTIFLDGHDIKSLSKGDVSNNITMISQKPFIFSGTLYDNLIYGLKSSGQKLPDEQKLLQILHDVGLEEDILWIGGNTVIPEDQARKYKNQFLEMRKIVRMELGDQFSQIVEFYDVDKFLYYATLRDNLIFGDSRDHTFHGEKLLRNDAFLQLLKEKSLEKNFLRLGMALAWVTIDILQHEEGSPDLDFFQTTPMLKSEVTTYKELLNHLSLHPPQPGKEKDLLLLLALRYIPARHDIVPLPYGLKEKIFAARHYFLNQIMKVDVSACRAVGKSFISGTQLPEINLNEEDNFIAYCPLRYLYNHTLRENIFLGSIKTKKEDIIQVRDIAWNAFREHGLLNKILNIGLQFDVGSQGSRLSGGQQQKIAIARGLLKETPVLILDEATSGLDNESQARIQNLLTHKYRGKVTVISIIHRLDLAPSYDRILVMKDGTIIEEGSFGALMEQKGAFYTLAKGNTEEIKVEKNYEEQKRLAPRQH